MRSATYSRPAILMLLVSLMFVTIPVLAVDAAAGQATLTWLAPINTDGSPPSDLRGYKVYVGTAPGSYSRTIDVGNVTTCTVSDLAVGTTYYFAVTAYDASANESGFSNEESKAFPLTYTVTATAGSGGSITPPGTVTVTAGESQPFFITPSIGYQVADVTVDGVSAGAVTSYTLSNITADHAIAATFAAEPLVKLAGNVQGLFPRVQDSYDAVPDGTAATVAARAFEFNENLDLDKNVAFALKGGYDPTFSVNPDMSTIDGTLTIARGSLLVENLIIR